jgi:hypothetical protein
MIYKWRWASGHIVSAKAAFVRLNGPATECGFPLACEILNGTNQSRRNIDTKSQISVLASGPAASLNG